MSIFFPAYVTYQRYWLDWREEEAARGLLPDGQHQPRLPHHGQVCHRRQTAERKQIRQVIKTVKIQTYSPVDKKNKNIVNILINYVEQILCNINRKKQSDYSVYSCASVQMPFKLYKTLETIVRFESSKLGIQEMYW